MKIISTNKPALWPSHRPDPNKTGWLKYCESRFQKKLYPLHRLDKETTGCFLFAEDHETAKKMEKVFSRREIKKEYYFITKNKVPFDNKTVNTAILNKKKEIKEDASTYFQCIKKSTHANLILAKPLTGRKHQIRIHAKEIGIPILGDSLYSDEVKLPTFFLHCHKMTFQDFNFISPLPYSYQNLDLFKDLELASILHLIENRRFLMEEKTNAYCLFHKEIKGLRIEKLGEQIFYEIYDNKKWPKENLTNLHSHIEALFEKKMPYIFQDMKNRGQNPHESPVYLSKEAKKKWWVSEKNCHFLMKIEQGKSMGLFLDQREMRDEVTKDIKNKSFLNLFCYTGGFSVYAAKRGAKEIVNVDTSKPSLEWLKENLIGNGLDPKTQEFWITDARIFLKGCINKKRKFDVIVCDPPSFARTKKKSFQIHKEINDLITNLLNVLSPGGKLYFSTNYEGWSMAEFQKIVGENISESNQLKWTRSGYDFEPPNQESILKGFIYFK